MGKTINILNKKARFEFNIFDTYTAGISLSGTEIKSIRDGKINLSDSYCAFINGELYVKNMDIAEYSHGNRYNHEPKRQRKLLLTSREIRKLDGKVKEKGFTVVPLKLFISDRGFAKLEIALAKGKKSYDKRETIKERDMIRHSE